METTLPSEKARAGSWHVLQETVPSTDKRPSKKSFSPRAIFSAVCGLSAGAAARVAPTGTPNCSRDLGSASGPAGGIGGACCAVSACAGGSKFQPADLAFLQPGTTTQATTTVMKRKSPRQPTLLDDAHPINSGVYASLSALASRCYPL